VSGARAAAALLRPEHQPDEKRGEEFEDDEGEKLKRGQGQGRGGRRRRVGQHAGEAARGARARLG